MTANVYEKGHLDLLIVGLCTFAKAPACIDWNAIDADVTATAGQKE